MNEIIKATIAITIVLISIYLFNKYLPLWLKEKA